MNLLPGYHEHVSVHIEPQPVHDFLSPNPSTVHKKISHETFLVVVLDPSHFLVDLGFIKAGLDIRATTKAEDLVIREHDIRSHCECVPVLKEGEAKAILAQITKRHKEGQESQDWVEADDEDDDDC